ncbi:hypothetical protein R3P38DRAFT_1320250 [Favolaschia claudopus]|uniref:Uncharacterized protein n=1 Tax=Favolaschia claudopus TaxID=2862362 RepID=A0AAW0AVM3_9AGAR
MNNEPRHRCMPSDQRPERLSTAEARLPQDFDFLSQAGESNSITINLNGGKGGAGGPGGTLGGMGGNGEGPQFRISTVEAGTFLVNGNAYYHCNSTMHAPQEWIILILLRRLAEYIQGDREKALFVIYCAMFALLCPGSLKLMDRLRLGPLIALPFLAIPSMLSSYDTITLVDVTGQCRPIFLAVWKNQEAFLNTLQELFINNEEILTIIQSDQYQIQDAEHSVYRPGSRVVRAGAMLFMTALFYRSQMNCPWCNAQVQVLPGWNLRNSIDCMGCKRRFSMSNLASTTLDHSKLSSRRAGDPWSNSKPNSDSENGAPADYMPLGNLNKDWHNNEEIGFALDQYPGPTWQQFAQVHLMLVPPNSDAQCFEDMQSEAKDLKPNPWDMDIL